MKRILALLLLFTLLAPTTVQAQREITLSVLEVSLWPEYDRPSILVIYHATLPPEVSLPVELTFRIPAAAGDPNAVAIRQVDGALYSVASERQVNGDWGLITFTATAPQIQLEYYDPGLEKQGEQRHFEYQWPGDYAVDSLAIEVQQPLGATDMRFSPSMGSNFQGQDGMAYYKTDVGSLTAGATFTIKLDYSKDTETLSAEGLEIQPSAPLPQKTAGQLQFKQVLPWVLAIMGIALIAGGGWWFWQSGRDEAPSQRRRRRKPKREKIEDDISGEGVYCHQCGKRAAPGDRFCRSCGTRFRTE